MSFFFQLCKLKHIPNEEFERLNWFIHGLQIQTMCQLNRS